MTSVGDSNLTFTIESLDLDFNKKKPNSSGKPVKANLSDRKNAPVQVLNENKT